MTMAINFKDKQIIRDRAKEQLDLAISPINIDRIELWKKHNAMKSDIPVIHLELGTFMQEVIPPLLKCESPEGKEIEASLLRNYLNMKLFDDDMVVPDFYKLHWDSYFNLFGHTITSTHAQSSDGSTLGHAFNHVISDLEADWDKLGITTYGVNAQNTLDKKSLFEDLFGDILPIKMTGNCIYAVPTQEIVHRMSMEHMFYAMYDYPGLFTKMMDRISDDYLEYFNFLSANGYLLPTTGFEGLGQGSLCFTDELPSSAADAPDGILHTTDVWGFLDSQETVGISPGMFKELIFPCYERIANAYGLLSYGCCEPVDPIWDSICKLKNLRKVSISPWCNEEYMAEKLANSRIIYHRKPSPNFLGVGKTLDEEAFRAHITKTLVTARGCKLEITQRDVYTINKDVQKARRYVQIIRECIEEYWKG
jgi:hypothetical protein